MPNVNLIAVRREEKKRLERNTRRLFLGLTVEVVAIGVLAMGMAVQQMGLHGALEEATARRMRLQPTLDRIASIEAEAGVLKPKLETLATAKADTLRWRAMLQIVSQSVPNSAWLTGITATGTGDESIITIAGTAGSQTLVGETMTRLQSYPVFDKVDLKFTQLSSAPEDTFQRVSFEIGAHLRSTQPPPPPAPAAAPAAAAAAGSSNTQASAQKEGGPHGKPSV